MHWRVAEADVYSIHVRDKGNKIRPGVQPRRHAEGAMTHAALIEALRDPRCYPHRVDSLHVVETHISWVVLTGPYAYKIKKPVNLGFLDFGTLEARRFYC